MKPASKLRVTNCAYVNGKTQRERSEEEEIHLRLFSQKSTQAKGAQKN